MVRDAAAAAATRRRRDVRLHAIAPPHTQQTTQNNKHNNNQRPPDEHPPLAAARPHLPGRGRGRVLLRARPERRALQRRDARLGRRNAPQLPAQRDDRAPRLRGGRRFAQRGRVLLVCRRLFVCCWLRAVAKGMLSPTASSPNTAPSPKQQTTKKSSRCGTSRAAGSASKARSAAR